MKSFVLAAALFVAPLAAQAMEVRAVPAPPRPDGAQPAFSGSVWAGDTLYVSGVIDAMPDATGEVAAKAAMDAFKRSVESAGATMDDVVWVQVFCTDLALYAGFNTLYTGYFKGPLPARAFVGTNKLLNGSRFEIMGVAVKR
ncbi:RidA family protein [Phenylobacterium immobile]|uniref:RidA family protein n=1 Tax=Phenylobacterium immobile TaxID=21 RepID=UPI000AC37FB4|nr:RidA family protein [Phenylobacterium immobile]